MLILFYMFLFGRRNIVSASVGTGCPLYSTFHEITCTESCFTQINQLPDFDCSVGKKLAWDDFRNQYDLTKATVVDDYTSAQYKPPLMTSIVLYPLPYGKRYVPALHVSFTFNFTGKLEETKAILLTFQSPVLTNDADKKYTDQLYSVQTSNNGVIDGRRYRLFDFSTSDVKKSVQQMQLDYKCLYGLDDCSSPIKIYTITLTSITMAMPTSELGIKYFKCRTNTCFTSSLNYTITVNATRYNKLNNEQGVYLNKSFENWKMTIATTNYPTPNDVYIAFEPPETQLSYYLIILQNHHSIKKVTSTANKHIFKSVPRGIYTLQIFGCHNSEACIHYVEDHEIVVDGTITDESSQEANLTVISAVLLAIVFSISLSLALFYCRKLKQKEGHKQVPHEEIELNPYDEPAGNRLKIRILKIDDDISSLVANQLIKSFIECGVDISYIKEILSYEESLLSVRFLIVLPSHYSNNKMINYIERKLIASFSPTENKNILVVNFPYKDMSECENDKMLQNFRHVYLMKDLYELLQFVNIRLCKNNDWERIKSQLSDVVDEAEFRLKNGLNCFSSNFGLSENQFPIQRTCYSAGKKLISSEHYINMLPVELNDRKSNSSLSIDTHCPVHGNHALDHENDENDRTILEYDESVLEEEISITNASYNTVEENKQLDMMLHINFGITEHL